MASRRKEYQEDAKVRVFQIISSNPQMTSRELAQKLGVSNGSAYYLLISFIDKGFVKLLNFKENPQKTKYSYILTPKGIREKSLITSKFLVRKKKEFEALRQEIDFLEKSIGNVFNDALYAENNNCDLLDYHGRYNIGYERKTQKLQRK
jgi:EPS-associated MarR family transcriptional regulator